MRLPLATIAVLWAATATAEPIVGRASVTDGDTVVIRGTRIRLHGIDAPESAQLCQGADGKPYRAGRAAALALSDRIGEGNISCEPKDTDRYGRTVAVCRKGAEDLNAWMVVQGHAIAYRRYSSDYVALEGEARAAKRGIWAGACQEPSEWRREKRSGGRDTRPGATPAARAPAALPVESAGSCLIKGNINRKGDHIYHMPGSRDYERTVIIEASGERMFSSVEDAEKAGWRAPGR